MLRIHSRQVKRQNKDCINTHSQTQSKVCVFNDENNSEHRDIGIFTFNDSDGILDEYKTLLR